VVPVAPPNQKERKEDQQTPPKTKNVSKSLFEVLHVENFSLLSLSFLRIRV
jgi:hypothetical protein